MDSFFSNKDPGYYSVIKSILPEICTYLDCSQEQILGIHSTHNIVFNLHDLGYVVATKQCANSIILGANKTYDQRNIKYCISKSKKIKYIVISLSIPEQRSVLITKRGCLFQLLREGVSNHKKEFVPINEPILDTTLLSNIINDTIGFVKQTRNIKKYDIPLTKGLIFTGSPGNGKTLTCSYLKNLIDCINKNYSHNTMSSQDLIEELNNSRNPFVYTFNFVDDIDINLFTRHSSNLACSLLTMMDGYSRPTKPRVIIFTTNEPTSSLDRAFFRPGRIDKEYRFEKPNPALREKLVNTWHTEIKQDINIPKLIEDTEEYSFAELNLIKTYLVSNFHNTKKWDINYSLHLVNEDFHQNKNKTLGF